MFCVQMATYISRHAETLLNCVHTLIYPFGCSFFYLPCRLACRLGLAAAWCSTYSSSSTRVESASALGPSILPTTVTPCSLLALAPRAGGRATGSTGGRWRLHSASCCFRALVWRGGGGSSVSSRVFGGVSSGVAPVTV
jgi:hypothetical protein